MNYWLELIFQQSSEDYVQKKVLRLINYGVKKK